MLMLPPEGNFASNINIMKQPLAMSIDDYVKMSKTQFEAMNMKVTKEEKIDENTVYLEYEGTMQGIDLIFSALAKSVDKQILLATATTSKELKEKHFEALKKSVQSLTLSK